ncbi:MAG: hypothetical protein ACYCXU_10330, partial [Thermoleophilia bacterium]
VLLFNMHVVLLGEHRFLQIKDVQSSDLKDIRLLTLGDKLFCCKDNGHEENPVGLTPREDSLPTFDTKNQLAFLSLSATQTLIID